MSYLAQIKPFTLHFIRPAGTSRGVYNTREIRIIKITDADAPTHVGWGECAPLPDLSCDPFNLTYDRVLEQQVAYTARTGEVDYDALRTFPSICFGIESALLQARGRNGRRFDTYFTRGEKGIPINGLIWMGDYDYMLQQIEQKLMLGFSCIKLKIGAINFEQELHLLHYIRRRFGASSLTIRVDANGAFSPTEAPEKLGLLANYQLHSIEQPIRAGRWEEMANLTKKAIIPIALDEELIGIHTDTTRMELLDFVAPQYIVLKPSLHGGIQGCNTWIKIAEIRNIGYWVTSALESNIGLQAIAQWASSLGCKIYEVPQGLGTGLLYEDNFYSNLELRANSLYERTGDSTQCIPF